MLQINHVYKTYDADRHALKDVSLSLSQSEFVFLSGPSGAGKTTLFKLISAQEKPTVGTYEFNGKNVLNFSIQDLILFRRSIGIVFQDFRLIPSLNIYENIALPLTILNISKKESQKRIQEIAESLNIKDTLKSFPDYLSGGEKQRVAIARALINKPQLIIADEPTGNLDKANSHNVLSLLKKLSKESNISVLVATHDEALIHQYGTRWLQLDNGNLTQDAIL